MNEAEVVEAAAQYVDTSLSAIALYASFTFAYLTAAYFVGAKLTRFQARMVSTLFVASAGIMVASAFATVQAWSHMVHTYPTILNDLAVLDFGGWHYCLSLVMVAGIISSLYFMYDVRKSNGNSSENVPVSA